MDETCQALMKNAMCQLQLTARAFNLIESKPTMVCSPGISQGWFLDL